jgi:hypothetical protein
MKDITHHQKRCAEIMGWNPENKFLPFYKSDWREQIPVWQKIVSVVVNMKSFSQSLKNDWANIRDGYVNQIHFGTPETAFTILCQAIDFIDANGKEKEK